MASPSVNVGTGTVLSFATATFSAEILSISTSGREATVLEASHLASVNAREYIAGALVEGGTITFECHLNADETPPIGTADTATITFLDDGGAAGATWEAPVIWQTDGSEIATEEKMTMSVTLKVAGAWTFTDDA